MGHTLKVVLSIYVFSAFSRISNVNNCDLRLLILRWFFIRDPIFRHLQRAAIIMPEPEPQKKEENPPKTTNNLETIWYKKRAQFEYKGNIT